MVVNKTNVTDEIINQLVIIHEYYYNVQVHTKKKEEELIKQLKDTL